MEHEKQEIMETNLLSRETLCKIASKLGLFDNKLTVESLTRDKLIQILLRMPQADLVSIFRSLAFESGKWTVDKFTKAEELDLQIFLRFMELTDKSVNITNIMSRVIIQECGYTSTPEWKTLDSVKILERIVEQRPKAVIFLDLSSDIHWLHDNSWIFHESKCDVAVVIFCKNDRNISESLLRQSWIYIVTTETDARRASITSLTIFASMVALKYEEQIPLIIISRDGPIEEISSSLSKMTDKVCHGVNLSKAPICKLLDSLPSGLSQAAEKLKLMINKLREANDSPLTKQTLFLEQLKDLSLEYTLIPDISSEVEHIFPSGKELKVEHRTMRPGNVGLCRHVLKFGHKNRLCLRRTPCNIHKH